MSTTRTFSLPALVIGCLLSALFTGAAVYLPQAIHQARIDERVHQNSKGIDKLVQAVESVTGALAEIQSAVAGNTANIASLTAQWETFLASQRSRDGD